MAEFKESASMLNGTACWAMRGCCFKAIPVDADPVNVTTSRSSTWSKMFLAEPHTNCKAPGGRMPLSWMAETTASVKKHVTVAGLTMAGTPANQLTATFSNMPHTGKLNALMCTATPRFGTKRW